MKCNVMDHTWVTEDGLIHVLLFYDIVILNFKVFVVRSL